MYFNDAVVLVNAAPGVSGPWNARQYDYQRKAALFAADRAEPNEEDQRIVLQWAAVLQELGMKKAL